MVMQPLSSVVLLEQTLPERFVGAVRVLVRKTRPVAVLALGLALVPLPTQAAFGQTNSQQEQQQRDERQREEQQREQQQRDQQQRDQQQRDQQQREEQQRQQEQRDQQQREQEQQRQQQQREQEQQREQQVREQQQRSSELPVPSSKSGSEVSHATAKTPATDVKRAPSDIQSAGTERKPDTSLPIKPAPRPIEPKPVPELAKKTCKDGPCQPCSSAQSKGKKDGPRNAATDAKAGAPAAPRTGPESCVAGQIWNGVQCLPTSAQ